MECRRPARGWPGLPEPRTLTACRSILAPCVKLYQGVGVVGLTEGECCSDIKLVLDRTTEQREELKDVWSTINGIRNRLPNWATFAFSGLFFLLGVAATLIVKGM